MMKTALFQLALTFFSVPLLGHALPAEDVAIAERGNSGCYPYENPGCGINYAVCQCANGCFYQYNQNEHGCNPPWGYLTCSNKQLKGWTC